jgi:hypothetical protein
MIRETKRFHLRDDAGRQFVVLELTTFRSGSPGEMHYRTLQGETVTPLPDGTFRLEQGGSFSAQPGGSILRAE